jgi:hypothetical protein
MMSEYMRMERLFINRDGTPGKGTDFFLACSDRKLVDSEHDVSCWNLAAMRQQQQSQ